MAPTARSLRRLLVEPPRPEAVRNSRRAPWLVVGAVCVGAFMGQLDASIVTLAFPTLRHSFHSDLASVQWVGLSYLLVLVGLLTAVGRYADMVGRKLLYTYGFLLFIIGSALCGLAPSLPALIGFRVVQGIGAAMLQANSVAIIVGAVPARQLGRAIGIQGAAQALGLSLGPAAGGLLIAAGGWRLIFFINVPVGLAATVLAWLLVPRSRDLAPRTRYDWVGLAIFLPAVCALLLGVSYGNRYGWGSPRIVGTLVAAVLLFSSFVAHERRAASPMVDLTLFSKGPFSAGIASGLLSYMVLFGTLTVVPFFLEIGRRQSASAAGAELFLLPFGLGVAAPIAGYLADRIGARLLTVGGMLMTGGSLILGVLGHRNLGVFLLSLLLVGIGLGCFTPPNNAAIVGSVPRQQSGLVSGVLNMTRGMGTSLGLALAGLVYTLGAGVGAATSARATDGFVDAAIFLAAIAGAAAAIAAVRGEGRLRTDATLTAE